MPIAYPVFFQMQGRVCLVAGGGAVGWRKARGLLESGARVVVIDDVAAGIMSNLVLRIGLLAAAAITPAPAG